MSAMRKAAVRRVNEWDGPSMLKIYTPYTGTPAAPEKEPPALQEYIQRIDRYTYGLGWLLCEIDSTPAGFCHLTEDREDPKNLFSVEFQLYVKEEFQRRGVGKALWSLMRDMMELGSRRRVISRVSAAEAGAVEFFQAMGFTPVRREQEGDREVLVLQYILSPVDPEAVKPVKPYLLDNLDYEAAREKAAKWVKEEKTSLT